jgi:hypothetical protein
MCVCVCVQTNKKVLVQPENPTRSALQNCVENIQTCVRGGQLVSYYRLVVEYIFGVI